MSRRGLDPARFLAFPGDANRPMGTVQGGGSAGELSGVRATMDELIAQEVAGGCDPAVATEQVRRIAHQYDAQVRAGIEPPPLRKD